MKVSIDTRSTTTASSAGSIAFDSLGYGAPQLNWDYTTMVGREKESLKLREALQRVRGEGAQAECILLHGYSGTGKSMLATTALDSWQIHSDTNLTCTQCLRTRCSR